MNLFLYAFEPISRKPGSAAVISTWSCPLHKRHLKMTQSWISKSHVNKIYCAFYKLRWSFCTQMIVLGMDFSANLSRRLMGELIVYQRLRRPSVRPSFVVLPSVNIFYHRLLWIHEANWTRISYRKSSWCGNESLFKWSWSHYQNGHHVHIWLNPLARRPMKLGLGM